jgi:resuscitation-promoting factor RpfB
MSVGQQDRDQNAGESGQHPQPQPPAQPKKRHRARTILGVTLAVFAVLMIIGAIAGTGDETGPAASSPTAEGTEPAVSSPTVETPTPAPTAPTASKSPSPTITKKTITETHKIPFTKKTTKDSSLAKGAREVRTKGVAGVRTLTYKVTLTDGVETSRKLLRTETTKKPVAQLIAIGTKQELQAEPSCDPNYGGACVPIASDVDCAGGSGNGPAYVQGPVTVISSDIYDLDRDGDGIACD